MMRFAIPCVFACALVRISLAEEPAVLPDLLFVEKLDAEARKLAADVRVRVDFFRPNTQNSAEEQFFAPGTENANRLPWKDILLVNTTPGQPNSTNHLVQIRALVSGINALIEKRPESAKLLPIRLYRTFMNEADDDDDAFERAYAAMYGKAERDKSGGVCEPQGEKIDLHFAGMAGADAIFVSDLIDVEKQAALNPARNPLPPSFATFDADAFFTQFHEQAGDEEADGWGFSAELRALGFVNAGLAHPPPRKFGDSGYQFSVSLQDLGILKEDSEAPEGLSAASRSGLRLAVGALKVGDLRKRLKHLGASEILGRPTANAAFIISTGVQKLVATARVRSENGDTLWRFPGIARALDGSMDHCLIRAAAHVFFFSGHGWDARVGAQHCPIVNCYTHDNYSVSMDRSFSIFMTPELPAGGWPEIVPRDSVQLVELHEKWRREEVNLQWLFLVGCQALRHRNGDPFQKWASGSGTVASLCFGDLNLKGVCGFSEHGFTGLSFMRRMAKSAGSHPLAESWLNVWSDEQAKVYTWYETNEQYGRCRQKNFRDLSAEIVPACLVRKENAGEALTPENVQKPAGGPELLLIDAPSGQVQRTEGKLKQ